MKEFWARTGVECKPLLKAANLFRIRLQKSTPDIPVSPQVCDVSPYGTN